MPIVVVCKEQTHGEWFDLYENELVPFKESYSINHCSMVINYGIHTTAFFRFENSWFGLTDIL